jgi:uncharacterized protein DUF4382
MRRLLATFLVIAGTVGAACYQDDTLHPAAISPTKVFLTDDPFPFDTVGSVNIYVTTIEATASLDTTSGPLNWVTIAAPNKSFDLLTLQQGSTALLGQATIQAGKYMAIRMTIDVDRSSIKYQDGTSAVVHWTYPGSGLIPLYAMIEQPLAVSATGSEIIIDFDVGRSFEYNLYGGHDFLMLPTLRAVNSAATGTIAGIVTRAQDGGFVPVVNADVIVYTGDPNRTEAAWSVMATGRTGSTGDYHVGFLTAGSYIVRIEQPSLPWLGAFTAPSVQVVAGATDSLSVLLPLAGAGATFINISGPQTVGVGGTVIVHAAVGDSNGFPEPSPQVNWLSRDTAVATVLQDSAFIADSLSNGFVLGRKAGAAWIVAQSGALKDSILIQVVNSAPQVPVASITLVPSIVTLAVGDTSVITAELRDSVGNLLGSRQVSWFFTDSTGVATLYFSSGNAAGVQGQHSGTTHLRAAIESKFKDATITVP